MGHYFLDTQYIRQSNLNALHNSGGKKLWVQSENLINKLFNAKPNLFFLLKKEIVWFILNYKSWKLIKNNKYAIYLLKQLMQSFCYIITKPEDRFFRIKYNLSIAAK